MSINKHKFISYEKLNPHSRPAFRFDDVKGLCLNQVSAQKSNYDKLILLKGVTGVQAFQSLDMKQYSNYNLATKKAAAPAY